MGLFTRKEKAPRHHSATRHNEAYTMHSRPTFGQWLKHTLLDILTMIAMGAIGLGVSSTFLSAIVASNMLIRSI